MGQAKIMCTVGFKISADVGGDIIFSLIADRAEAKREEGEIGSHAITRI